MKLAASIWSSIVAASQKSANLTSFIRGAGSTMVAFPRAKVKRTLPSANMEFDRARREISRSSKQAELQLFKSVHE